MRRLWTYFLYLLVVWSLFRYWIRLPEVVEELWFKPVIWLTPLFWWQLSFDKRIEMFGGRWMRSVVLGAVLGLFYMVLLRGGLSDLRADVNVWGMAMAVAITEELTFSGFVAGFLERQKSGWWASLLVGLMVAILRLPILAFVYKVDLTNMVGAVLFAGGSAVVNAWLRLENKNVAGSVIARWMMNMAVLG